MWCLRSSTRTRLSSWLATRSATVRPKKPEPTTTRSYPSKPAFPLLGVSVSALTVQKATDALRSPCGEALRCLSFHGVPRHCAGRRTARTPSDTTSPHGGLRFGTPADDHAPGPCAPIPSSCSPLVPGPTHGPTQAVPPLTRTSSPPREHHPFRAVLGAPFAAKT